MTAQVEDLFRYRGLHYAESRISEGERFKPERRGLEPVPASTACYRGYRAVFALASSQLVLDTLDVNLPRLRDIAWGRDR